MLSLLLLSSLFSTDAAVPKFSGSVAHFEQSITRVESMVWDQGSRRLAQQHGLNIVNVSWEDTGRYKGSSVGPNISDMTIGVRDSRGQLHPMPVFRFDNFSDKTADIRSDKFYLRTGNEKGLSLYGTSLKDILTNIEDYLHEDDSWNGSSQGLWNSRDEHVLVSAQACFLPIPQKGEATFTPVIYNYQSSQGNLAVMTIVATREGTSIQVVENSSGYMSEVLYFNENGERAPYTAMRLSDFQAQGGDRITPGQEATEDSNLNAVLVIQVPLEHRTLNNDYDSYGSEYEEAMPMVMESAKQKRGRSDVETAVISHGETEGPFKELNGLTIKRDARFPVRVTVQFYKATSNGIVTNADVRDIRKQIDQVYSDGDYVGSLVSEGITKRPTEWITPKDETSLWANSTWSWHTTF